MTTLRFGIKVNPQATTVETLRAAWRIADEAGFDHLWVYDHLAGVGSAGLIADPGPMVDVLDGWTLLGAMAEVTHQSRIGCMVTANTLRHPAALAKMATTVDHLSGGRLEMGIGAGWAELEHSMTGIRLGGARERIEKLDETCHVLKSLWTLPVTDFTGLHYQLKQAVAEPKPLQGSIPLWIGGSGERRMLRLVAEHADVWNMVNASGLDECVRKSAVLDQWCTTIGRDPSDIRRSIQLRPAPTSPVPDVAPFVEAGFTEIVMYVGPEQTVADVDALASQLPALREIVSG